MKIEYDKKADAIYIQLNDRRPVEGMDIEEGVTVDLDRKGHIVGIELLDASERIDGLKLGRNVRIEPTPDVDIEVIPPKKQRRLKKAV